MSFDFNPEPRTAARPVFIPRYFVCAKSMKTRGPRAVASAYCSSTGAARNGQTVAVPVVDRFSVRQQHVMVRTVARQLLQGDLPAALHAVVQQRHFLPVGKCAGHLHHGRFQHLAVRQTPAEDFGEGWFGSRRFLSRTAYTHRNLWNTHPDFLRPLGSGYIHHLLQHMCL